MDAVQWALSACCEFIFVSSGSASPKLAGLLAIALLGLTIQAAFAANLNQRIGALEISAGLQEEIEQQHNKLAAIEIPSSLDSGMHMQVGQSIKDSFVAAFRRVVFICAGLAIASALAAVLTIRHDKGNTSSELDMRST